MSAAGLIIGNEILSGKTADRNSGVLATELRALGVELRRILVVPDQMEDIVEAVRLLAPRHDLVFTSGGVGPTHDDITLEAVARGLGRRVLRHPEMAALLERWYDVQANPLALHMADLPEGAELVYGEDLKVPTVVVENIYILPGVPALFERKLKAISGRFRAQPFHLREVFVSADEVEIAAVLYALVDRHPGLALGSYPEFGNPDYAVKLTLESRDQALVARALEDLLASLPAGTVRRSG